MPWLIKIVVKGDLCYLTHYTNPTPHLPCKRKHVYWNLCWVGDCVIYFVIPLSGVSLKKILKPPSLT